MVISKDESPDGCLFPFYKQIRDSKNIQTQSGSELDEDSVINVENLLRLRLVRPREAAPSSALVKAFKCVGRPGRRYSLSFLGFHLLKCVANSAGRGGRTNFYASSLVVLRGVRTGQDCLFSSRLLPKPMRSHQVP